MNYNNFIKRLAEECNDNGVHITQPKLKQLFEVMEEVILDTLEEEDRISLRGFLIFDIVEIPPKTLPDKTKSKKQYGVRVRLSKEYKKKLKEKINNKED